MPNDLPINIAGLYACINGIRRRADDIEALAVGFDYMDDDVREAAMQVVRAAREAEAAYSAILADALASMPGADRRAIEAMIAPTAAPVARE
jgi:hypothetical protein